MYSSYSAQSVPGPSAADLSNNPFINDPSNAHTRFPDINSLDTPNGSISPPLGGYGAGGVGVGVGGLSSFQSLNTAPQGYGVQSPYGGGGVQSPYQTQLPPQPQPQGFQQFQPQPQLTTGWSPGSQFQPNAALSPQPQGIGVQMTGMPGYQPQQQQQFSSFGGYASPPPQVSGSGYAYLNNPQYGQQQQPQQPTFLTEFDPINNRSQPQSQSQYGQSPSSYGQTGIPQQQQQQPSQYTTSTSLSGQHHPREFIRLNKLAMERWDVSSWKAAISSFDALRAAWEVRKDQIDERLRIGGFSLGVDEGTRLQALQKEAIGFIDTIAASSIQMQEAFNGYRHSADPASKNRVRTSLNAALQGLPDWPQ